MNSSNPDVPLKCEAGVSNSLMHVSNVFIPNGIMRDYLTVCLANFCPMLGDLEPKLLLF